MEYQKIINLLDNTSNQPSKFRTKIHSQIKFKTIMLKSSLCDYGGAYILVKGTVTVPNIAAADVDANNANKKVIFKNCAPFINCISEINNTQVINVKDIDIEMPKYNLREYNDNELKISGSFWQYCKDIPALNNNGSIVEFQAANPTDSFSFIAKITGQTGDNGTNKVEIMVPLKYLSNFWKTLEMPLINCEINFILSWSANCVIIYTDVANQGTTFAITETKLYVPLVTLSTQGNSKLLQQLKSSFKRTINWSKYQ